ncbi:MAG: hypothetical protein Q7U04_18180 [Bacteriovorax sp.]|nr:hypothetical protein [Bacteriovorax sp.]
MRAIFIFFTVFFQITNVFSREVKKRLVLRDENFRGVIQEKILPDLISNDSYNGKYFKIVYGKSNNAISFDETEDIQLKAATTYYHLNKARNFFVNIVHSQYVQNLPQIVVRIDLINVFNEVGHFANDNLDPQFNNALTVPEGAGYPSKEIGPWGIEVWFRPAKEINIKDFPGSFESLGGIKASLISFRNQTHMSNFQSFINSLLLGGTASSISSNGPIRLVGSSIMVEAIYQSSDFVASFFGRKIYRLDAALVPEIIYHEFSHVALSEHLELSHSTPVNEGLADYFAGKISNSKKLAMKIKDYNLFNGKEVKKKQQYQMAFERGEYANTDFVFGLLWNIGETIGIDIENDFIYHLASRLSTNVSIRDDLIQATLDTCKLDCKNPLNDRLKLYKLYSSKNF